MTNNQINEIKDVEDDSPDLEDFENDQDLELMRLKLEEVKKERKQADQDNKILGNRLNLLKEEEEKSLKNIEKQRRKEMKKIVNSLRNEDLIKYKNDLKQRQSNELENKRIMNQKMREEIKTNTLLKKEMKSYQVQQKAKLLRIQKKSIQETKYKLKEEEIIGIKDKNKIILNTHKILVKNNDENLNLERRNRIRMELEQKLLEEEHLRELAEEKFKKYEQSELDIINRIKTTNQLNTSHTKLEHSKSNLFSGVKTTLGKCGSALNFK